MSAPASTAKTADTMIGRKIGHYAITRRIGQGGMGVVYEAVHDKIKQRVAIKVLHKEMSQDEKVVQRFFNEANAISMAQHSSIVKIMDYGQLDDGTAYIMMEFLDGEPLLSRIERAQEHGTGLGLHMVVELGRQTATALGLIHEKNIVHRDLKPENIFIVPDTVAPLGERV
ncbi:MAG TPA: serine/threonine-protein kinase, partial [Pseudomonadota bacterium]|nr:serine/threonine-protein kinase [Pseudomonadota bacterium]